MSKNNIRKLRVVMAFVFLVLIPIKYAALSVIGTTVAAEVASLSSGCSAGKPTLPQPRLTARFLLNRKEYEIQGGQEGISEFCDIKIGDMIHATYFFVPKINYMVVTIGNPKRIFFVTLMAGFSLFVVGNLLIMLSEWRKARLLKSCS